jgi:hypothetical protein
MLMKLEQSTDSRLGFMASGRLTDNDYKNFLIPQVSTAIRREGHVCLLFQMEGFRGWDVKAAWHDLVFGLEINRSVEKIAFVGDRRWERWIAGFLQTFTHGEVRYFDQDQLDQAWCWVKD